MPALVRPWPFQIVRLDGVAVVRLLPEAVDDPRMREDAALAWAGDGRPRRVILVWDQVRLVTSTMLGWLLRLVDLLGMEAIELRSLAPAVAEHLRVLGFARLVASPA